MIHVLAARWGTAVVGPAALALIGYRLNPNDISPVLRMYVSQA